LGYVPSSSRTAIFTTYKIDNSMVIEGPNSCYGLDIGYTNDPTALVHIQFDNNNLKIKELLYGKYNTLELSRALSMFGISFNDTIIIDNSAKETITQLITAGFGH